MNLDASPEEKAAIVLEILREENTLTEIAKKYDVSQQLKDCVT